MILDKNLINNTRGYYSMLLCCLYLTFTNITNLFSVEPLIKYIVYLINGRANFVVNIIRKANLPII